MIMKAARIITMPNGFGAPGNTYGVLYLLHWDERRSVFILDKEYEKLGWFGIAGILRDNVDIIGRFIKRLAWSEGH